MIIKRMAQQTDEWFVERAKRPTASNFHRIITASGKRSSDSSWENYALELCLGRLMRPELVRPFFGNDDTDRGNELEPEAIALFERMMGLEVERVGFVTTDDGGKGCSPDGLIPSIRAGLEVKCPNPTIHARRLLAGVLPDDHKQQVHGGMDVTGYYYWYYMSYCPVLPPLILRVERDGYTEQLSRVTDDFIVYYADFLKRTMPILRGAA